MKNCRKLSVMRVCSLVAALLLLGTGAASARSVIFIGGRPVQMLMNGGYGNYGGYSGWYQYGGQRQNLNYQAAALAPRPLPSYSGQAASDYLASVCGEGTYTWQTDKLPIKVWIGDGTGVPGYKPLFQTYVRNAFDTWCAASENKLAWVEVADASQADVTVRWTNQVTERPEGTEAGRTSAFTKLNTATGKGIIYGARMQFLTRLPERYFRDDEVEKTTLHEVGHAMGLQGHSPYRSDIMYYAVGPGNQPRLTERDCNTLHKLYASFPTLDAVALSRKASSGAAGVVAR